MARSARGAAPSSSTDTATKGYVDARTPKITASSTAPSSPSTGDVWIDTSSTA